VRWVLGLNPIADYILRQDDAQAFAMTKRKPFTTKYHEALFVGFLGVTLCTRW
jgi:hypothetical protein